MTSIQKVIKYFAIAFAILLIINIIFCILWLIGSLKGVLGLTSNDNNIMENMEVIGSEKTAVNKLKIELGFTSLEIKRGEEFKVETNNSNVKYKNNNGIIKIEEVNNFWNYNVDNNDSNVIIYVPENMNALQEVYIESTGGLININNLQINKFDLEQGAGKVLIENLIVIEKADIEGGTGKMDILSSSFNNLDLNLGVGEFNLNAILTGNNEIESGVGSVNINLINGLENYKIRAEKGLGSIKINNENISNNEVYGNGNTNINIEGGIGNININ